MTSNENNRDEAQTIHSIPNEERSWKQQILAPTLLAGLAGGALGLVSKHRKTMGVSKIAATYATDLAIVTACYCGAREFVRVNRNGADDLLNSAIGGAGSGAILGRLQGGKAGAIRYSIIFAVVGTAADYTMLKLRPTVSKLIAEKDDWLKVPEWSPIKFLDEEAIAAKKAREQELYRRMHNLRKEES